MLAQAIGRRARSVNWHRLAGSTGLLVAAFFLLLLARRGQQLVQPQVWNEEGTNFLPGFISAGISFLLEPGRAYFLLAPKLISGLSLACSFSLYPLVSTLIAWAFTILVLVTIARHPSTLAGGPLLAFAVLMIPTNAETFGVPLYALWWAPLLQLTALFWNPHAGGLALRAAFIAFGGLSSPLILATWPLFMVRTWLYRHVRREWVVAGLVTLVCAVQIAMMRAAKPDDPPPRLDRCFGFALVPGFFGRYLVGAFTNRAQLLVAASIAVLGVIGAGVWRTRRNAASWFLVFLILASIALGVIRVGSMGIHPLYAGPRYFFYPFILISWLLLQFACDRGQPNWLRGAAGALLVTSVVNALPHFCRFHEDLGWRAHVASSVHFDAYAMPVQFDGVACRAQSFTITGKQAEGLLARDPFAGWVRAAATHPHTFGPVAVAPGPDATPGPRIVAEHDWTAVPAPEKVPPGFTILRSPTTADAVPLKLAVHRGDRVLFRSAERIPRFEIVVEEAEPAFARHVLPSTAWKTLVFSNRLLPETFTLVLSNRGSDPGQWVEVGVPDAPPAP